MIKKTEVMVFGGSTGTPPIDLGSWLLILNLALQTLVLKWTLSLSLIVKLL